MNACCPCHQHHRWRISRHCPRHCLPGAHEQMCARMAACVPDDTQETVATRKLEHFDMARARYWHSRVLSFGMVWQGDVAASSTMVRSAACAFFIRYTNGFRLDKCCSCRACLGSTTIDADFRSNLPMPMPVCRGVPHPFDVVPHSSKPGHAPYEADGQQCRHHFTSHSPRGFDSPFVSGVLFHPASNAVCQCGRRHYSL